MSIMPSTPFPPTPAATPDPQPTAPVSAVASSSNPMVARYIDAYRVAGFSNGLGQRIKVISLIVGGLIFLIGLVLMTVHSQSEASFFGPGGNVANEIMGAFTMAVGFVSGALGFLLGILVSAIGQLVKATLDGAVNTSPFLDNDERARMMYL